MSVIDQLLSCSNLRGADILKRFALSALVPSSAAWLRSLAPVDGRLSLFRCFRRRRRTYRYRWTRGPTPRRRAACRSAPEPRRSAGRFCAVRIGFPRAVPEFAIDPCYPSDEAVRLDGAKDRASLRIDLMDLAFAMLPDPEAPFRPRHSGGATVGCRDGSDHMAGRRIDLLDAIPGDLVQVLAIEGCSRIRRDIEGAHRFPTRRVDRVQ